MIAGNNGGGLGRCDGAIANCTIVSNTAIQGSGLAYCNGTVTNCIIWDNDILSYQTPSPCWTCPIVFSYCCFQGMTGTDWVGNMGEVPLFIDPNNGNYHLKSEYGRWDPDALQWVYDDVTSPCIDAGDPGFVEWQNELWPHGGRVNMGAYGGTAEASMSGNPVGNAADLDHDDEVGVSDLLLLSEDWLYAEYLLDTDLNRNGVVDIADFGDFARQWLRGVGLTIVDPPSLDPGSGAGMTLLWRDKLTMDEHGRNGRTQTNTDNSIVNCIL